MNIKNIVDNDEYLSEKKDKVVKVGKYLKHQWLFLLAIFGITLVASLTAFTSSSYFNNNSRKIEATALTAYPDDINEITMRSTINFGVFPHDVFSSPDDQITYLQETFPSIKTFKTYKAYNAYRGTDTVNGFYYVGNPKDKPDSTYEDRFNDNVRKYTDFLCVDDGSYLDIELEYSSNPVRVEEKDEEGNVISSHLEYKFMTGYTGNEIYLPYDFASNILLPQYQNGYFGHNPDMTLQDLLNKEFVLFSAMANRFTVDGHRTGITETPFTYIIKGITKDDTAEDFRNYFILPFNKSMLTQPSVYFKASTDAAVNDSYLTAINNFNSSSTMLTWGVSTRFSEALSNYVKSNTPAKRLGIFMALTILILVGDGYVFYLYLKNVIKKDKDYKASTTAISSIIVIFFATLFGGAIAKLINGSSLFAWSTSIGKLKTSFFTTGSSILNSVIGLLLMIAAVIATVKYLKYYKNKEMTPNELVLEDSTIQDVPSGDTSTAIVATPHENEQNEEPSNEILENEEPKIEEQINEDSSVIAPTNEEPVKDEINNDEITNDEVSKDVDESSSEVSDVETNEAASEESSEVTSEETENSNEDINAMPIDNADEKPKKKQSKKPSKKQRQKSKKKSRMKHKKK